MIRALLATVAALSLGACSYGYGYGYEGGGAKPARSKAPADFAARPAVVHPADNPTSPYKVALGRDLFADTRLSADGRTSCASCHQAEVGFGDGLPKARGRGGRTLERNTPTLWNVAFASRLFWDGRAESLEQQALMPVFSGGEMARHAATAIDPIRADPVYRARFAHAFPENPSVSEGTVSKAIAAYERTLVSGTASFDRWIAGDTRAINDEAKRGFALFTGKARCSTCHNGANFTDQRFHDVGLPDTDLGVGAVTNSKRLDHAFRTPSLREVERTAPYMHDGSLPDLSAVVDHYATHTSKRRTATRVVPLDAAERRALVAFLRTLSTEGPMAALAPARQHQRFTGR